VSSVPPRRLPWQRPFRARGGLRSPSGGGRRPAGGVDASELDDWLLPTFILLAVGCLAAILGLGHGVHLRAPGLDIVLDTATTGVTAFVAALSWLRYRETGDAEALLRATAFLVFSSANLYSLVLAAMPPDALAGPILIGDGAAPLWITTVGRAMAALMLVAPAIAPIARRSGRHPVVTLWLPIVVLLALIPVTQALHTALPPLSDMFELHGTGEIMLPGSTLLGTVVQLAIAGLCFAAAAIARDSALRTGSAGDRYMAVALLFAAFSQVMLAFYPGTFPGVVGIADVLRLAFDVTLLLAVQAEASSMLRRLRAAAVEHEQLRQAEADRSAIEERARLARELHDGLAQDLWLAKLKASRLAAITADRPEATQLCEEVQEAIDTGLTEAMQVVTALRLTAESDRALGQVLTRYMDDLSDRFALRVVLSIDPDLPRLPPRTEAEMLRIAQESLANVRRHADATVVRVTLGVVDDAVVLSIRDNGRGFDAEAVDPDSYGLAGMRERAALIGGSLAIESRPSEGTLVTLSVPAPEGLALSDSVADPVHAGDGIGADAASVGARVAGAPTLPELPR
jgi:signal transduction histidine kinase